ncbi:MAG: DUF2461 domain-containing protein [Candidatus Moduliflexus flocculans]|nr:DUF2461 domain-containing protein [Candidatus Moduliflexus flocculans]
MNDPERMDSVLSFLRDLRAHNDRAWFEAERPRYEAAFRRTPGARGPEAKSGVRSYYLHVEPDGKSMLAGGPHSPSPAELGARDFIPRALEALFGHEALPALAGGGILSGRRAFQSL